MMTLYCLDKAPLLINKLVNKQTKQKSDYADLANYYN